jgi:hypothetical protein
VFSLTKNYLTGMLTSYLDSELSLIAFDEHDLIQINFMHVAA